MNQMINAQNINGCPYRDKFTGFCTSSGCDFIATGYCQWLSDHINRQLEQQSLYHMNSGEEGVLVKTLIQQTEPVTDVESELCKS